MRFAAATALVLSVSSVGLLLTPASASADAAAGEGALAASYYRGGAKGQDIRRSLGNDDTDMEYIDPLPSIRPRMHGKPKGDPDEDGLLLGHGFIPGLDPRGAGTNNHSPKNDISGLSARASTSNGSKSSKSSKSSSKGPKSSSKGSKGSKGSGTNTDSATTSDSRQWEHSVTATYVPDNTNGNGSGTAAISSTAGAQGGSGANSNVVPLIAMAASVLLVGLIILLVGKKNRDRRLNMQEDGLGLRKNAGMLPYDLEDCTEYSGSSGSNMVRVVGESRALDLSDDMVRALAASNVHKCRSASCPTCTAAGKEPVFVDVEGDDSPAAPPSDLRRNKEQYVGHVVGAPSNEARASNVLAALSFGTGSIISSDESSIGLKSTSPPDIFDQERRQRNDDLSAMANDDAERSYQKGDTVDL